MKCSNCNNNIPDDSKFCNHCGPHIEENEGVTKCSNPQCGKEIPSDSKFCPFCGTKVSSASNGGSIQDKLIFEVNGVSFNLIRVEHGSFMMGDDDIDSDDIRTQPAHKVVLTDDYYIGETLVTQDLWVEVMEESSDDYEEDYGIGWKKHPIPTNSWDECQEFIQNLNRITCKNFRLPTEAEWEFAARGGNKSRNFQYAGSNDWTEVAWLRDNSYNSDYVDTHPVALLNPNELGLYDMSGNAREWCADWYGSYSSENQINPKGPKYGRKHMARGGDFSSFIERCYVVSRDRCSVNSGCGIRLVLPVKSSKENNFL